MESDLIIALSRFLGRIYRAHRHISFQINVIALRLTFQQIGLLVGILLFIFE